MKVGFSIVHPGVKQHFTQGIMFLEVSNLLGLERSHMASYHRNDRDL